MRVVHVAAGVLFDRSGRFLLTSRPSGKSHAGCWEFAGGKIEEGETPLAALKREFAEELGITVEYARPWLSCFHRYQHHAVRLSFFRIAADDWTGEPSGREGQALLWQEVRRPPEVPVLAASVPIVRALAVPTLLSGSPETGFSGAGGFRVAGLAAAADGADAVLRETGVARTGTGGLWYRVSDRREFDRADGADAVVWQVGDDVSAAALTEVLRQGVAVPVLACARAELVRRWAACWHEAGLHGTVVCGTEESV